MPVPGPVRDMRFHTDIMVGNKQVVPASNVENGKNGWVLLVDVDPRGKADKDHVWVGHIEYGWTRLPESEVRFQRYWSEGDKNIPESLRK